MATTITANGINFPDGSAGSPSIGGTDTNTGLFTGSDIVGFATGGSERLRIDASGNVNIANDSGQLRLGTGADLLVYHNGSDSYVKNSTGDLYIRDTNGNIFIQPKTDENGIKCIADGAVELYYDNSKKLETTSSGVSVTGGQNITSYGGTTGLGQLNFGASGTPNIKAWDTGNHGSGSKLLIRSGDGDTHIECNRDGNVELYHDNSKKLETTSSGTTTTGDGYLTGRLLVGTTTAGESNGDEATFYNSGNAGITIRSGVNDECKIYFSEGTSGGSQYRGTITYHHGTDYMSFATNENERMRINSDGDVFMGTTTINPGIGNNYQTPGTMIRSGSGHYIAVSRGQGCPLFLNRDDSNGTLVSLRYNATERGTIQTDGTNVAYNTSSDYRLKENVVNLTGAIDRLKTLLPKRFNFKELPSKTVDGFLAHEVTAVPEAITGTKDQVATEDDEERGIKKGDPIYQGIDQSKLVPLLTAALQEAVGKIETLETKVAALEAE